MDTRTRRCVFLGYPNGYSGYNLDPQAIFVSRDLVLHEDYFLLRIIHLPFIKRIILFSSTIFRITLMIPTSHSLLIPSRFILSLLSLPLDPPSWPLPITQIIHRQSTRPRKTPSHLHDCHCYIVNSAITKLQSSDSSKSLSTTLICQILYILYRPT